MIVALTARDGEPGATGEVLAALRNRPRAVIVAPDSLSDDAVATLVRSALGDQADPAFCSACARASAGNPFLLRELVSVLEAERVEPVAANAARVQGVRPEAVSHAVVARLARLGGDASVLARSVAVLESASLRQAAALAGIDHERARIAADRSDLGSDPHRRRTAVVRAPAAAPGRVRGDPAGHPGRQPSPGWPAARGRGTAERARGHAPAAQRAGRRPRVVDALRDAAREALADGAPPSAVRLLRRALEEPPAPEQRAAVLGELGEAEALARDPAAAQHLREALELSDDPVTRARVAGQLGSLLVWVGQPLEGHALLAHTIDELPPDAPTALRAMLETVRVATASVDRRLVGEVAPRLPALHELARRGGTGRQRAADLRGLLARAVRAVFGRLARARRPRTRRRPVRRPADRQFADRRLRDRGAGACRRGAASRGADRRHSCRCARPRLDRGAPRGSHMGLAARAASRRPAAGRVRRAHDARARQPARGRLDANLVDRVPRPRAARARRARRGRPGAG